MNSGEKHFIVPICISSGEKSKLSLNQLNELNRLYMDLKQKEIQTFRDMIILNQEFQIEKSICENTILFYHINITKSILYLEHGYTKSYI